MEKNPARYRRFWLIVGFSLTALMLLRLGYMKWYWPSATVRVGEAQFRVLVADTAAHDSTGWRGHTTMGSYDGMLFYFASREQHPVSMAGLSFPLDIIWIDHGVVVDIAKNVPPEPNQKDNTSNPYLARLPSTLVLEVGGGKIDQFGIGIGDSVIIAR